MGGRLHLTRRTSRMWQLINEGKRRPLTEDERAELQRLFLRLAEADVRVLRAENAQ